MFKLSAEVRRPNKARHVWIMAKLNKGEWSSLTVVRARAYGARQRVSGHAEGSLHGRGMGLAHGCPGESLVNSGRGPCLARGRGPNRKGPRLIKGGRGVGKDRNVTVTTRREGFAAARCRQGCSTVGGVRKDQAGLGHRQVQQSGITHLSRCVTVFGKRWTE